MPVGPIELAAVLAAAVLLASMLSVKESAGFVRHSGVNGA